MNPQWLREVNHDNWATVRSCDIRVIATQEETLLRDPEICVIEHGAITKGSAPIPEWDPRYRFLQKNLTNKVRMDFSVSLYPNDVGFDTIDDTKWIVTGGLTQNIILGEDREQLNVTVLYGLPGSAQQDDTTLGSSVDDPEEEDYSKMSKPKQEDYVRRMIAYYSEERDEGLQNLQEKMDEFHEQNPGFSRDWETRKESPKKRNPPQTRVVIERTQEEADAFARAWNQRDKPSPPKPGDDDFTLACQELHQKMDDAAREIFGTDIDPEVPAADDHTRSAPAEAAPAQQDESVIEVDSNGVDVVDGAKALVSNSIASSAEMEFSLAHSDERADSDISFAASNNLSMDSSR